MAGVASRPVDLTPSARTRRRAGLWPASPGILTRPSARRAVGAMPQTTPLWVETSEVPTFRGIMIGLAPLGLHPRAAALHRGATLMAGGLGDSVLSHQTVYNELT